MTYGILLAIAFVLSLVSLRYRNILFSLGGAVAWLGVWNYHTTTPPAGIEIGSTVHEWLMYIYIIMAIGVMFVWFRNREKGYTGYTRSAQEEREYQRIVREPRQASTSLISQSEGEYKDTVRRALHPTRRRR